MGFSPQTGWMEIFSGVGFWLETRWAGKIILAMDNSHWKGQESGQKSLLAEVFVKSRVRFWGLVSGHGHAGGGKVLLPMDYSHGKG